MNDMASVSGSSMQTKPMAKNTGSSLSMDRAAFLLIRIKRVFQKKKRKIAKSHMAERGLPLVRKSKPPMLRARTLPAIIPPALNIIQAQLDPSINNRDSIAELPSDEIKSQYLLHEPQYKYSLSVAESDSYVSKSPGISPRHSVSSTSSTGSTKDANKKSVSFAKLTKLLSTQPKEKYPKTGEPQLPYNNTSDVSCFFWNNSRPNDKVKRSGSVDSLIDAQQSSTKNDINIISIGTNFPMNPTDNCTVNRGDKIISSGFSNRFKDHLAISSTSSVQLFESHQNLHDIPLSPTASFRINKTLSGRRQQSVDVFIPEDLPYMTKAEKKKFEKYNKFNFDVQAMFSAVENEQLERTRMIIESTDVDINSCNTDGFSPLDIAVMTLNIPLIKLLQSYGSKESSNFITKESREKQLNSLLKEAERCVLDLNLTVFGVLTNGGLSAALLKEKERQLCLWERRLKLLQRMKIGFERLEPPESPTSVQLEVVGRDCLKLKFCGPIHPNEKKCIVTKYKVEWSGDNFETIDGTSLVTDPQKMEVMIDKLETGRNYSVRVSSGNCKGFSAYSYPSPNSAIPSSWRDVDQKPSLDCDNLSKLDHIYRQMIDCRQNNCTQVKVLSIDSETSGYNQKKGQVRKSIKNLFGSAPKFQKAMKRGIYLSCLIYNEDRILVTNDEIVPVVEIDDVYPSSLQNDFYWMLKISSTWEDVKALRRELDKSQSSSVAHFRSKILSAVEQMQTSLGIQDLGKLFYKPLKDSDSTTVLCTIKKLVDIKSLNCLSLRWLPFGKLQKKLSNSNASNSSEPSYSPPLIGDLLLSSLQEMICYHKACNNPLPRGLYLGFVKLKTSVEIMSIVVPQHSPNVIPHIKIRDNPHVSKQEWNCLKQTLNLNEQKLSISSESAQLKFLQLIGKSANFLLNSMRIPENEILDHRVYDIEVIELSPEVSFVLLLPPVENVCSIFGQTDELPSNSNLIYLPLRIFEMINLNTYQQIFVSRYSRTSAILEMDILVAQQAQREAFSSTEVMATKSRVTQLQEYQTNLEEFWRSKRWIMNVVTFARDKQSVYGISLLQINQCLTSCNILTDEESLFQIPIINLSSPTYESPVSTPPPHPTSRRPSRDDSTIDTNYFSDQLKISTSSSSYSLIDSLYFMNSDYQSETYCPKNYDDMRRCVSASKLINGSIRANTRGQNRTFNKDIADPIHLSDDLLRNTKFQFNTDMNQVFDSNVDIINESNKHSFSDNMFRSIVLSNISEYHDSSDQSFKQNKDFDNEFNTCGPPNTSEDFPVIESNLFCDIEAKKVTSLIRIYVAYDCGLPFGTSIKLQITDQTTVREIIDLVVTHLNSLVQMKGKTEPVYHSKDFHKFCLIAVFSSNVKHLNDDFKIVNLQTPWNRAKICIKIKDNFFTLNSGL